MGAFKSQISRANTAGLGWSWAESRGQYTESRVLYTVYARVCMFLFLEKMSHQGLRLSP